MANKFNLQIITPEREFLSEEVDKVIFHTSEGEIGVLHDHIPLTTTLKSGKAVIKNDGKEKIAALHSGFAEISEKGVTILTDAAEWPDEIDIERAKQSEERAKKRMENYGDDIIEKRLKASLARARVRIQVASEYHNKSQER